MERELLRDLLEWKHRPNRKPLILRGARQVGKTHLVRAFANKQFSNLVEINFDQSPEKVELFSSGNIDRILKLLEIDLDVEIHPNHTLLFFDEIQNAPKIISLLRYFYEKKPNLHVIAAGSLLDFALSDLSSSMPVGRIEYLFMGPMNFQEFLSGHGADKLLGFIQSYSLEDPIPLSIHNELLRLLKIYCAVGGMPAAVKAFTQDKTGKLAAREQQSILQTYQDDFGSYQAKINGRRLRMVFKNIPFLVAKKLKYSNVDQHERAKDIAECIALLQMARVIRCVPHSSGNGIPLGAESNRKDFKPLFIDVGLLSCALGLKATEIHLASDLTLINNGIVAEQFAGQHLLYAHDTYLQPELFYWNREKRGSSAEVDYLFSHGTTVIPIEIKAGKTGSLKSLQVFASEKKSTIAVRFNTGVPSLCTTTSSIASKQAASFQLLSLPLYLIGELKRLLESIH